MGKKDTVTKKYLSDNERFADLFNVNLFGGKKIIHADELKEQDSTEIVSYYDVAGKKKSLTLQKWRDVLKKAIIKKDNKVIWVLLGVENQSDIHYAMVIKNMLYDAMSYSKQVESIANEHRKNKDTNTSAEFLSGLTKEDKLMPVITLTVYWKADEWDAPMSLKEMLDTKDEEILSFVNDYKLNLVTPNSTDDMVVEKYTTELGKLLKFIKVSENREETSNLLSKEEYKNVSLDTVDMMNTLTGIKISKKDVTENGGINVCKAWADQRAEGIAEGIAKGRAEGKTEGIAEGIAEGRIDAIKKMLAKGYSKVAILDLDYTEEEIAKAEQTLVTV